MNVRIGVPNLVAFGGATRRCFPVCKKTNAIENKHAPCSAQLKMLYIQDENVVFTRALLGLVRPPALCWGGGGRTGPSLLSR